MNTEIKRASTQQPMDDEERALMDPATWDWDAAIEGQTIGGPGAILRVRFSREEFRDLERFARKSGVGPIELIRQTMLDRIAADEADRR